MRTVTTEPSEPDRDASGEFSVPSDGALLDATTTAKGFRNFQRYTYWSIVSVTLVMLLLPALTGPVPRPPDLLGSVALGAVVVVAVAVVKLIGHHIPRKPGSAVLSRTQHRTWAVVGGLSSLILAGTWVAAGDNSLWCFGPAMVASLVIASLPRRRRRIAASVTVAIAAVAGMVTGLALDVEAPLGMAITGTLVTGFALLLTLATIWSWQIVVQLNDARRTAATLAVANERLRFAADLHDIQGHNLQVIALKSELAARLLDQDPAAARHEIAAVQDLATDALRDTRAVVQGYRRATLRAEIANATTVLGSAGIDTALHLDPDVDTSALPETSKHLLGLVVREAVTNVLRHSAATRAEVTLSRNEGIELRVTNDGVTENGAAPDASPPGGGLADLAERLRTAGGTLTWRRSHERFAVEAHLPETVRSSSSPQPSPTTGAGTRVSRGPHTDGEQR